jgi:hypothetical protein
MFTELLPRNGLHNPIVPLLLATAVSLAPQFLHGANTPQYITYNGFNVRKIVNVEFRSKCEGTAVDIICVEGTTTSSFCYDGPSSVGE